MVTFAEPPLKHTLGVALLGNLAAAALYGMTSIQSYVYYRQCKHDPWRLKCSIFLLWVLDGLHLALITRSVYECAVIDFANPQALIVPPWSLKAHVAVAGLINALVRFLFGHRMWKFSKRNRWLASVIGTSTTVAFVGSMVFSVRSFLVIGNVFRLSQLSWILYTSLGAGIVTDVTVAISLCILLRKYATDIPLTRDLAQLIMIYGINTGLLTSLCEIACLVTYATMPDSLLFIAIFFVLPKLLLNALLATLNARPALRKVHRKTLSTMRSTKSKSPYSPSSMTSFQTHDHRSYRYTSGGQSVNLHVRACLAAIPDTSLFPLPTPPPHVQKFYQNGPLRMESGGVSLYPWSDDELL
ncbi:hypothetical protein WOLCODRAFT_162476 [Wolfiporia cocos MD-104 SS10]|uniref:DUF6534 domain-containing protein n=1 Tax=Wolfiporia cocos (strain MD-104) TaxID=742152 RepID=A0A2H3JX03_WOLCO|nr:hypothetical protein WOLCODRAFT_162476 [Wolfiporia cocos MD-104 SS10]